MARPTFGVSFGAMAPPLAEQLAEVLGERSHPNLPQHQKDADAIARLAVRGVLTETEAHRARKRLMKRLEGIVREASAP